jgi:hypothetical protein
MNEDPYNSEEYQKFLDEMSEFCFCEYDKPCEGVLAGGLCDRKREDDELIEFDDGYTYEDPDEDLPW